MTPADCITDADKEADEFIASLEQEVFRETVHETRAAIREALEEQRATIADRVRERLVSTDEEDAPQQFTLSQTFQGYGLVAYLGFCLGFLFGFLTR